MSSTKVLLGSALVVVLASLAFAAGASAHTLTESKARKKAQGIANGIVQRSGGDYVSAVVKSCKKLFPHRVQCNIGFHDEETRNTKKYACNDKWMMYYKAHDDDEAGDPTVWRGQIDKHPC